MILNHFCEEKFLSFNIFPSKNFIYLVVFSKNLYKKLLYFAVCLNCFQIFKTRPQFADLPNVRVLDNQPVPDSPSNQTGPPAYSGPPPYSHSSSVTNNVHSAPSSGGKPAPISRPTYPPPPPSAVRDPQYNNYGHSPSPPSVSSVNSSPPMTSMTSSTASSATPTYANLSDSGISSAMSQSYDAGQTYAQYRAKLRPTGGFYSQYSG